MPSTDGSGIIISDIPIIARLVPASKSAVPTLNPIEEANPAPNVKPPGIVNAKTTRTIAAKIFLTPSAPAGSSVITISSSFRFNNNSSSSRSSSPRFI